MTDTIAVHRSQTTRAGGRGTLGWLAVLMVSLLVLAPATATAHGRPLLPNNPLGVSAGVYLSDPLGAEKAMFSQAGAMRASTIRLDLEVAGVFPNPNGKPDWGPLDQYLLLARVYHLRVLAVLDGMPWYLAGCPAGTLRSQMYRCPPASGPKWWRDVREIAAHTRGTIDDFEIWNEPDGRWAFLGSPAQYASMLSIAYDAIHAANPTAAVLLGGLMRVGGGAQSWMNGVLSSRGADALHKFDIANIHVRGRAALTGSVVCAWRHYFAAKGFRGPLWVTETGYSAKPAFQTDPAFQGGLSAQAGYLVTAVRSMVRAGAAKVFVTERDDGVGRFGTEGVLQTPNPLPSHPSVVRRPSFYAIRRLVTHPWAKFAGWRGCPIG